jgi:RNA polymerase sigma factor (sigma-70 family)
MEKRTRSAASLKVDERNKRNVDAYLSGDKYAISNLYEDNYMFVKNAMSSKLIGKADVADDLTQDVMIRMINNLSNFKNTETLFRSWLTSISKSVFIDYVRKSKSNILFEPLETSSNDGGENFSDEMDNAVYKNSSDEYGSVENTFSTLIKKERRDVLMRAINGLENISHKRIMKKLLDGKSYKEISEETGESMGSIKSIIFRVKKELSSNKELIEVIA